MRNKINKLFNIDVLDTWQKQNGALLDAFYSGLKKTKNKKICFLQPINIIQKLKKKYPEKVIITHGSPFLWNSILNIMKESPEELDDSEELNYIMLNLIDCYFDLLPEFKIELSLKNSIHFSMACLGLVLKLPVGKTEISKKTEKLFLNLLECIRPPKESIKIKNNSIFPLILTKIHSILPLDLIKDVDKNANKVICKERLETAFENIKIIDKNLHKDIEKTIKFLIPLITSSEDLSISFSTGKYNGIIFTTFNTNSIWLAETIIHEYSHNYLNIIMNFFQIIEDNNTEFYSPWRPDPRPMVGLFHGIFAFTMVANFLDKCFYSEFFGNEKKFIEQRLTTHLYRLKVAFMQVKTKSLTQYGKELYELMQCSFSQIKMLKSLSPDYPEYIKDHSKKFNKICVTQEKISSNVFD